MFWLKGGKSSNSNELDALLTEKINKSESSDEARPPKASPKSLSEDQAHVSCEPQVLLLFTKKEENDNTAEFSFFFSQ